MRGFIALISVLIISAVLVLLAISAGQLSIGELKMTLQRNQALQSYYLAHACAEEALMKLKEDLTYVGSETLNINEAACDILNVEGEGNKDRIVKIESTAFNQTKKIKIKIDQVNPQYDIAFWQEVSDF